MFRPTDSQGSLFETSNLLPEDKRERLERDWPGQFRREVLPLIDEGRFRGLYCENNGRPNKPVRQVVGLLLLKEMYNLTDAEVLWRLDFDLSFHVALGLTPEEAHCCQKTLHNFRTKLLETGEVGLLFAELTDAMCKRLGLSVERQRLDSTHVVSDIARLSRLGLFCETIRVVLRDVKKHVPKGYARISKSLIGRYLKEDGKDTLYPDARSEETSRRLKVSARDVYRLRKWLGRNRDAVERESYRLLERLLNEQCQVVKKEHVPEEGDGDAGEGAVPVMLKESKQVSSSSLQTPHDADVTYSGHKGKGYEVQVAETVGNGEKPELILHVEVTPSCGSDESATVSTVKALAERDVQPKELLADTNYASAENVIACAKLGTEVVAPVKGTGPAEGAPGKKTLADFEMDPTGCGQSVRCPAGHEAEGVENDGTQVKARYAKASCAGCRWRSGCPAVRNADGTRTLKSTAKAYVLAKRRRYEKTEAFRERYAPRAGIEGTNSELKRGHGLGKLRVRGGLRVRLSVKLKALGCNVKRMVRYLAELAKEAARRAARSLWLRWKIVWSAGHHAAYVNFDPTRNTPQIYKTTTYTPHDTMRAA